MVLIGKSFYGTEPMSSMVKGKKCHKSWNIIPESDCTVKFTRVSSSSPYYTGIAFSFEDYSGEIIINDQTFEVPSKKRTFYVIEMQEGLKSTFFLKLASGKGKITFSCASDTLGDYREEIEKFCRHTGTKIEDVPSRSFKSGLGNPYAKANMFWIEQITESLYRFHCNDHLVDDDFDDLIFDVEVEPLAT